MSDKLQKLIAKSIKEADNKFIFEDYIFQANNVIKKLKEAGFLIMPKDPDPDMIKAGEDAVFSGKIKPQDLIINIYHAMLKKFIKSNDL